MLTKGAIGNLINRYRAVLKKCHLLNTFGSLAVAAMLVMGGAGAAGAASLTVTSGNTKEVARTADAEFDALTGFDGAAIENRGTLYIGTYLDGSEVKPSGFKSTFTSNKATNRGGAIYNTGSVTLGGTNVFKSNTADNNGGAIYNYMFKSVTLDGTSTFTSNTAGNNGGAIYAAMSSILTIGGDSTFEENTAANGGAIHNRGTLTIDGSSSTFKSNTATGRGGAICNDSIVYISNATFGDSDDSTTGNSAQNGGAIFNGGTMTLSGTNTFASNRATNEGGAIHNMNTATLDGTTSFALNTAPDGGAIYNFSGKTFTFYGTHTFDSNKAHSLGGGVVNHGHLYLGADASGAATGSKAGSFVFTGNSTTAADGKGGAIYTSLNTHIANAAFGDSTDDTKGNTAAYGGAVYNAGTLNIYGNTDFYANKATKDGGAIYNDTNDKVSITGDQSDPNLFAKNSAVGSGGAIYNKGKLTATNVDFKENSAKEGGALYNEGKLTATNADFKENSAKEGGALYNEGTLDAADVSFTDNTASNYGGAVYNAEGGSIESFAGTLQNNSATYYGGGIYNKGVMSGSLVASGNKASYGGAIYNAGEGTVTLSGTNAFDSNTADNNGGAVYNSGILNLGADTNGVLPGSTAGAITFIGNQAQSSYGGAIYNSGTAYIANAVFGDPADSTKGNSASYGGAIYNSGTVSLSGTNAFSWNTGSAIYNSGTVFLGGTNTFSSNTGGAIRNDGIVTLIGTSSFASNTAERGGAIYNKETVNLGGISTFASNTATANGGAIYNKDTLTFSGISTFESNSATSDGGAVYNIGVVTLNGISTFASNTADNNGGAIYNHNSANLTLSGTSSTFESNEAALKGGAIYNEGTASIADATFGNSSDSTKGNSAQNGGAIFNGGTMILSGTNTFASNKATSNGGAIYHGGAGTLTLSGTNTFASNKATSSGGAIYNSGTLNLNGTSTFTGNMVGAAGSEKENAIHNTGTVNVGGTATITGSGTMVSGSTGTLKLEVSGKLNFLDGDATSAKDITIENSVKNSGTLSAGTSSDAVDLSFNNTVTNEAGGSIAVSGTLNFKSRAEIFGGSVTADSLNMDACDNVIGVSGTGAEATVSTGSLALVQSASVTVKDTGTLSLATDATGKTFSAGSGAFVNVAGGTFYADKDYVLNADYSAKNGLGSALKVTDDGRIFLYHGMAGESDPNANRYTLAEYNSARNALLGGGGESGTLTFVDGVLDVTGDERVVLGVNASSEAVRVPVVIVPGQSASTPTVLEMESYDGVVTVLGKDIPLDQDTPPAAVSGLTVAGTYNGKALGFGAAALEVAASGLTQGQNFLVTVGDGTQANRLDLFGTSKGIVIDEKGGEIKADAVVKANAEFNVGIVGTTAERKATMGTVIVEGKHCVSGSLNTQVGHLVTVSYDKLDVKQGGQASFDDVKVNVGSDGSITVGEASGGATLTMRGSTVAGKILLKNGSAALADSSVTELAVNGGTATADASKVRDMTVNGGSAFVTNGTEVSGRLNLVAGSATVSGSGTTVAAMDVDGGTASVESSAKVDSLTVNDGTATVKGRSQVTTFNVNGGTATADASKVKEMTVNGGSAFVTNGTEVSGRLNLVAGSATVSGSGTTVASMDVDGGTASVESSAKVDSLTVNDGTATVKGSSQVTTFTVNGGTATADASKVNDMTVKGGSAFVTNGTEVSGRLNLVAGSATVSGSGTTVASMDVDGGSATVTNGASVAEMTVGDLGTASVDGAADDLKKISTSGRLVVSNQNGERGSALHLDELTISSAAVPAVDVSEVKLHDSSMIVRRFRAKGGKLFLDPSSMLVETLEDNKLNTQTIVGEKSLLQFGDVQGADAYTANNSAVVLGYAVDLGDSGSLLVDKGISQNSSYAYLSGGSARFGAGTLLAVKASTSDYSLTGKGSLVVDEGARLYLDSAAADKEYLIASFEGGATVDGWQQHGKDGEGEILDGDSLIVSRVLNAETVVTNEGKVSIKTTMAIGSNFIEQCLPKNSLVELAHSPLAPGDNSPGKILLSRAADPRYIKKEKTAIDLINESARAAVTAGVQNTALRVADAASNTVIDHMSLGQHDGSRAIHSGGADFWAAPIYGNLYTSGMNVGGSSVRGQFGGLALGADVEAGQFLGGKFRIGTAIHGGGGRSEARGTVTSVQNDYDFGGLSFYAGWNRGAFNLIGSLGYGFGNYEVDMALPSAIGLGTASADIDTTSFTAELRAEYQLKTGWLDILPHAGVRYTALQTDSHDLTVKSDVLSSTDSDTQNIVQFPVGVTLSRDFELAGWNVKPGVDVSFIPAAGDKDATTSVRYSGMNAVDSFDSRVMDSESWAATVGVQAEKGDFTLGLNYGVQTSRHETDQNIQLKLGWKF